MQIPVFFMMGVFLMNTPDTVQSPRQRAIFVSMMNRSASVSFTGHRSYRGEADAPLRELLRRLYGDGFRSFFSGMAVGFDLAAAEAVLELKAEFPDVRLVCVLPFEGQERRFPETARTRYRRVLAEADERIVVCPEYRPECYRLRNDRLVAEASLLVAWYDGSPGGTGYTVRRAERTGIPVEHLAPLREEMTDPRLF